MAEQRKILKYTEIVLVAFAWIVILLTPILFREDNNKPLIRSLLRQLEVLIPLMLLFLVNRFMLVPGLLFKRKAPVYMISVFGVIALLTLGIYFYHTDVRQWVRQSQPAREQADPPRDRGPENPDQPGKPRRLGPGQQRQSGDPRPIPPYANFLIFSILLVGFDTGIKATLRWNEVEQEKVRLEKENIDTQLVILRNQVSPHFFMNTLNNIHSLIDINTGEAKEAVIKLSKIMRYLLYENEDEKTTLKREIAFLESYIDLMKLRFSDKVSITLNVPAIIPDKSIPPFLFTSIIENAFKHGISYQGNSFINIDMTVGDNRILLMVRNSKAQNNKAGDGSGLGLENTRKRLDLLFGGNYHLDIIDTETQFTVNLSIPV